VVVVVDTCGYRGFLIVHILLHDLFRIILHRVILRDNHGIKRYISCLILICFRFLKMGIKRIKIWITDYQGHGDKLIFDCKSSKSVYEEPG